MLCPELQPVMAEVFNLTYYLIEMKISPVARLLRQYSIDVSTVMSVVYCEESKHEGARTSRSRRSGEFYADKSNDQGLIVTSKFLIAITVVSTEHIAGTVPN